MAGAVPLVQLLFDVLEQVVFEDQRSEVGKSLGDAGRLKEAVQFIGRLAALLNQVGKEEGNEAEVILNHGLFILLGGSSGLLLGPVHLLEVDGALGMEEVHDI